MTYLIFSKTLRKRLIKLLLLGVLTGIIAINILAWMQAKSMTHFVEAGDRTAKPESLSFTKKLKTLLMGVSIPKPKNLSSPRDYALDFETRLITELDNQFLEAWFIPNSEPRAIVIMFHGYAACKSDLLVPATEFHNLGYDVLLIDFHGSGGSTGQETTIGFSESKAVAESVDYARSQWPNQRIILYGVSMGSAAILRAIAIDRVEVDAMILESPFDRLINTVRNRFKVMGLPTFPGAELLVFWGGVQQGFNGFKHNPVEYARSVDCRALIMYGKDDDRVTQEQARAIYDNLAGEKSFKVFSGVGHELLGSVRREEWLEQVKEFLNTKKTLAQSCLTRRCSRARAARFSCIL